MVARSGLLSPARRDARTPDNPQPISEFHSESCTLETQFQTVSLHEPLYLLSWVCIYILLKVTVPILRAKNSQNWGKTSWLHRSKFEKSAGKVSGSSRRVMTHKRGPPLFLVFSSQFPRFSSFFIFEIHNGSHINCQTRLFLKGFR